MLLIHSPDDPHSLYSHYLAEILKAEGFADFSEGNLSALDKSTISSHDIIVLPRLTPTKAQAEMLADYVKGGGRLISFQPGGDLPDRLGLKRTHRGMDGGYLHPAGGDPVLRGLSSEAVQTAVPAVEWTPSAEARVLAWIRDGQGGGKEIPGVVWSKVGKGEAIFFAYDLPYSVARLRQGNPEHRDLCFGGLDGIYRPSELFIGQLDARQVYLPQADIQTAFLSRLIETLSPRPRVWYYPEANQHSVMLMTSDDDWSTVEQFEAILEGLRKRQAHTTFYVVPATHLTRELMDSWEKDGHTFSVHPALEKQLGGGLLLQEPQQHTVSTMVRENIARHEREFGRRPRTIRHHAVRWMGYVEVPRLLADLGIGMDLNYVSVHPFPLGYMAGSGRPMRFVDTDGSVINCYQQPTLWTEEVLIHPEFVFSFKWTVEKALEETGKIIERAAREFYTPVAINSHPVSFATYSSPLVEGVWDKALSEGMPIMSADEWLAWTEARDGIRLERDAEGWAIQAGSPLTAATVLLPTGLRPEAGGGVSQQSLWGREYTTVTVRGVSAGERRRIARFASKKITNWKR